MQDMSEEEVELVESLKIRGVVGIVGRVDGGDDMGFVTHVYPVTLDGLVREGQPFSVHASLMGDLHARVLAVAGRVFHEAYPYYGTGRSCSDSFLMPLPSHGEELSLSLGSEDLEEDAQRILQGPTQSGMRP